MWWCRFDLINSEVSERFNPIYSLYDHMSNIGCPGPDPVFTINTQMNQQHQLCKEKSDGCFTNSFRLACSVRRVRWYKGG
jgi:hypothetical protein